MTLEITGEPPHVMLSSPARAAGIVEMVRTGQSRGAVAIRASDGAVS